MDALPSILLDFSLYKEIAFFPTLGQSTVHNLTHFPSQSSIGRKEDRLCRKHDLLVASLLPAAENISSKRCCNLYSFNSSFKRLIPIIKSFDFMYLPVADIVCMKAFYDDQSNNYVVSMGLVKEEGSCFFNIYSASSLSDLPECCICLSELDHFPIQVAHTYFISPKSKTLQWAFLLSTSPLDLSSAAAPVQVYTRLVDAAPLEIIEEFGGGGTEPQYLGEFSRSTNSGAQAPGRKTSTSASVNSVFGVIDNNSARSLFPELQRVPPKVVTFMEFLLLMDGGTHYRLSALGTLDGWIGVGLVDMGNRELKAFYSILHDSTITGLKFFRQFDQDSTSPSDVSLLVCSGLEPAVVYRCPFGGDPGKLVPSSRLLLPQSADFDHVNCACVADLDFDGCPEIVVGTFGQQLLFYNWISQPNSRTEGSYALVHQKRMAGAVHSLECGGECDFLGDGTRCLAVLTSLGLHLLQCSQLSNFCLPLLSTRLRSLPSDVFCP